MLSERIDNNENATALHDINVIVQILILIVSLLSVIFDILIGLILIIHYYFQGETFWAIITFNFIFFPSIIIQILSIKFYLASGSMMIFQWILHSLLLGVIHRYIRVIKKCMTSSKSNLNSNLLMSDIRNLNNLYLFKSFLECGPQLVFQLYILGITHNHVLLIVFSAVTSAFSMTWALIVHTDTKKGYAWPGLMCLALWRAGMISARISALVLCLYICGPWIMLFIGSHWLAMTLWITYQKAAKDECEKKGEFYSALLGIIYCFCFFPLKTGPSTTRAIIINLLLVFENWIFLTVFLMEFSATSPVLAVLSFVIVVFGDVLGMLSFLVCNKFFHPTGSSKCGSLLGRTRRCDTTKGLLNHRINLCSLSHKTKQKEGRCKGMSTCESEQLKDVQSPTDSVIIIEEDQSSQGGRDENACTAACGAEDTENIYDEPVPNGKEEELDLAKLSTALKRRAICSSGDLSRFHDKKSEDEEIESNRSSKEIGTDGPPSEMLSAHDYENLCAVNIAREAWGIRSWRGYSDIETWRHDDSVFNERRLDNLTTSSEYSGKIEDKDFLNSAEDDLVHCDVETISDKISVNFLPPMPASMLHTIFEEREASSGGTGVDDITAKCSSESALVATIDKICLYTPLRTRSGTVDNYGDSPQLERLPETNSRDSIKNDRRKKVKRGMSMKGEKRECIAAVKDRMNCVQRLTFFKEKLETNRYQISSKSPSPELSGSSQRDFSNSIAKTASEGTQKRFTFKGKSNFLIQVLTPSKFEKRTFHISPPKR